MKPRPIKNSESRLIWDLIWLISLEELVFLNYNIPFVFLRTLFIFANNKFLSFKVYFSSGTVYLPTRLPLRSYVFSPIFCLLLIVFAIIWKYIGSIPIILTWKIPYILARKLLPFSIWLKYLWQFKMKMSTSS